MILVDWSPNISLGSFQYHDYLFAMDRTPVFWYLHASHGSLIAIASQLALVLICLHYLFWG